MRISVLPIVKSHPQPLLKHISIPATSAFHPSVTQPNLDGKERKLLPRLSERWTSWASKKWDNMSRKPAESVSKRVWIWGEKVKDFIDADEWFLKGVPGVDEIDWDQLQGVTVPVHYPKSLLQPQVVGNFNDLINRRTPLHHRGLTLSIVCLPFSMMFVVFPGPNVPLAWNLFRLYSNWRALQGIRTLKRLQTEDRIVYVQDSALDKCLETWGDKEIMPREVVEMIVERQAADDSLIREWERAVKQVTRRMEKAERIEKES
ncbi:uncharacterized protein SPPG_05454 [Spizellomyces punctatus DAOM BR117]|uniref:Uncharacterized protein n=1 Tax=Spizellomyces punctatus (strain DAOM BR117) TaxID=645134 RepID=A0A0L0HEM1_SPIPD|nr:uncharacterized protein SPPG_05454 [Spizellomyces punctatus DAOM BR117]KNC99198.1 hypothetical protein SPPG_05454 [Spizellomyces punctatus DAOM BR117]|eukprot:XP_016607238.1 hypothetical protein SPPG_05454 [Spizellomyces punctatus DAOM BR117]